MSEPTVDITPELRELAKAASKAAGPMPPTLEELAQQFAEAHTRMWKMLAEMCGEGVPGD